MQKRKRTIFWIIPIAVLGIFIYVFGPKSTVTDNDYISYIKAAPLTENSNVNNEAVFINYCEKSSWEYFQTKMMEHVVEFKGKCEVNDDVQSINLQYVVEKNQISHHIGALLVDGVQQSEEQRAEFLQILEKQ
ncbi:glucosamine 6-phosphate synthetase [Lysinibacillus sp. 2017]|uniref:glucosamine 6-phosphate synthetase n=1 Tax=unclassified Lysinibacillus TaxID=2636778 RepID=UPI000D527832|nr:MULTISPECIES: glucosamine 6-phosphate synthetase [unclassified Lysinibacillus]AWE07096.1 glucosamine 6-phosphate synthetase [Lysinibacillus sp. 2017]TGN36985.1 glucosamine 6-phosphate synthetase [Lysinibacillus sp. S2017]